MLYRVNIQSIPVKNGYQKKRHFFLSEPGFSGFMDFQDFLEGSRKGQHSIRINEQWRICFEWTENNAYEVEIADYH